MDRDEAMTEAAGAAGQELLSTGSLTSAEAGRPRARRRTVVLALSCAALLAGGFAVQRLITQPEPASPSRAPHAVTVTGPREFPLRSGSSVADVVVAAVERVPTGASESALQLLLRLRVSAGADVVTTESFVASGSADPEVIPAGAVTVLSPDSHVVPSSGGFRIAAPASVELVVMLAVPPGDHVVSILGDATDRTLASFAVHG